MANRKGGTGKTTTAVNLAAELASAGYRTLLVDLDTQCHASLGLGYGIQSSRQAGVHQIFHHAGFQIDTIIRQTPIDSLSLLPADPDYAGNVVCNDIQCLAIAFQNAGVTQRFEHVILDTPPTQDIVMLNALFTAQGVLAPFIPHHLAGIAIRQMAKLFYRVATYENTELHQFGLLPVMLDRRMKLHRRVISGLTRQFGRQRIFRGIRSNIQLAESFEQGQPIRNYAPRSPGAMDFHLLADEIREQWIKSTTSS